MKKIIVLLILAISINLNAQFFVQLNSGYSLPAEKSEMPYPFFNGYYNLTLLPDTFYTGSQYMHYTKTDENREAVKANFAEGFKFGLAGGYSFKKYFAVSFNVYYTLATSQNETYKEDLWFVEKIIDNVTDKHLIGSTGYKYQFFSKTINSALFLEFHYPLNKIEPYLKLGPTLAWHEINMKSTTTDISYYPSILTQLHTSEEKYTGSECLGFSSALGCRYNFNNFAVFADFQYIYDNFTPSKARFYNSKYSYNGSEPQIDDEDMDLTLVANESETIGGGQSFDPGSPTYRIKSKYSFSSFSFNIGIQYSFGKSKAQPEVQNIN